MKGAELERIRFRHPLYARDSLGVLGDYVTLDAGTGAVHTAPGHGADDFNTGMRYGLEIYAPVGPAGHFLDTVELFGGQRVFDANPNVEEALKERGRLWHREAFAHQYPHCWRCHNPVIFLATSQWFIAMDGEPVIGDGRRRRRRCARRRSTRSTTTCSGSRRGATTASTTWSRTAPTGASRASAPGACRSRRSTARSAARRSLTPALVERAAGGVRHVRRRRLVRAADRGVRPRRPRPARRAAAPRSSAR